QGYGYPPQGFAQPPMPTWGVAPAKRASNPLPWILAGVGLLVVFVVVGIVGYAALTRYRERAIAAAAAADDALGEDGSIPISSHDPSWGDRYAPVTIVEFAEFE